MCVYMYVYIYIYIYRHVVKAGLRWSDETTSCLCVTSCCLGIIICCILV